MSDWVQRPNELAGLLVGLALGLGLVSVLVFARAMEAGLPRRRVRRLLLQLWAAAGLAVAVLGVARVACGHALVSGSASGGVQVAVLGPGRVGILAGVAALLLGCLAWIRHIVGQLAPRPDVPTSAAPRPSDDEAP
jgi:hypothetical protein